MTPVILHRQGARAWGQAAEERERRHARVDVKLKGRGLLSDGAEFELQTVDLSAGGMCVVADVRPTIGEAIVVYLELIGGLEGEVVRATEDGFCIQFRASLRKREKIADQLTWLINREHLGDDGQRRDERIKPHLVDYMLRMDESEAAAVLIDLSRTGAALLCPVQPAIGTWVNLGRTRSRVIRHMPGGFAVEFARVIPVELFDADITL